MINTGIFPDKLKIAKVIPIYKKGDYRPMSLLPSIFKVFEKVIFKQLYSYFENEKIFNAGQYGFKSGHSTELAVLEIIDRITIDMDNGKIPINIYLDLSKAFDTLDHSIDKLKHYGICHKSISLLKSYLSHRKQYVTWNDIDSQYNSINTGVPQGSILGPLLFIIYINDFSKASELFDFIMYADDTTLMSVLNAFGINKDMKLNDELHKVSEWLLVNRLSLNTDKTKCMIFHQCNKIVEIPNVKINNVEIECVNNFNLLGININKNLNWKHHTDK